jgi:hypothetical protein
MNRRRVLAVILSEAKNLSFFLREEGTNSIARFVGRGFSRDII